MEPRPSTTLVLSLAAFVGCSDGASQPSGPSASVSGSTSVVTAASVATATATVSQAVVEPAVAEQSATASSATGEPGMVLIPAGFFLIGSPMGNGNPEERPAHERVVGTFYMDETEVTAGAYAKCVAAGKCAESKQSDEFCSGHMTGHDDHPINCVNYEDATSYCAFVGKRLPNEAEWEYAASGGGDGRTFSWGNADPTTKNTCFAHPGGSCPVKSFPAGAFGLYDMSGNVWEWTSSWFALFPGEPADGTRKVFKGGSWSRRWPKWLRVKNRSHWEPQKENSWLGFRCVKTQLPLECPTDAADKGGKCERVRGEPRCEPQFGWNGSACTRIGADGKPSAKPEARTFDPSEITDPTESISMARTPKDDPDCEKNYPGKPAAYRWTGNTWEARVKLVKERGCTRRDNGTKWVSACCRS
ncbi:MAG: SUMF1/EgtB/PvdO family nonheme iron enzyme [Polyangiaceae bacterium]|nr:SUMF1/EgtB/PvdO family nonheme iron enzyme [Polyangiaceae bacterium]